MSRSRQVVNVNTNRQCSCFDVAVALAVVVPVLVVAVAMLLYVGIFAPISNVAGALVAGSTALVVRGVDSIVPFVGSVADFGATGATIVLATVIATVTKFYYKLSSAYVSTIVGVFLIGVVATTPGLMNQMMAKYPQNTISNHQI